MQAAFFKLANVIELDKAIEYLKESIAQTYRKKGQAVVDMNCKAVDSGIGELNKVNVPESWKDAVDEGGEVKVLPEFVEKVAVPMLKQEGDSLPISAFDGREDGSFPLGTAAYEKRSVAVNLLEDRKSVV